MTNLEKFHNFRRDFEASEKARDRENRNKSADEHPSNKVKRLVDGVTDLFYCHQTVAKNLITVALYPSAKSEHFDIVLEKRDNREFQSTESIANFLNEIDKKQKKADLLATKLLETTHTVGFKFEGQPFTIGGDLIDINQQQNEFSEMVSKLVKPGEEICRTMTPEEADLWHMATGIGTEAGELLDAAKKHVIYKKPLDLANVIEELGDLEFYMEGIRQRIGTTREEVLANNIAKLSKRYKDKVYSDKDAIERADKQ